MLTPGDVVNPSPERLSLAARLLARSRETWVLLVLPSPCVEWTGYSLKDYGRITLVFGPRLYRPKLTHRVAYSLFAGEIPAGLTLDHLCRNRACFNPSHLEPVRLVTNVLRGVSPPSLNAVKTHCERGHEFTPENTYVCRGGYRDCKTCSRERSESEAYRAKRRSYMSTTYAEGARLACARYRAKLKRERNAQ